MLAPFIFIPGLVSIESRTSLPGKIFFRIVSFVGVLPSFCTHLKEEGKLGFHFQIFWNYSIRLLSSLIKLLLVFASFMITFCIYGKELLMSIRRYMNITSVSTCY